MATGTRYQVRKSGRSLTSLDTPVSRRVNSQEQVSPQELRPLSVLGQIYSDQNLSHYNSMEIRNVNADINLGARNKTRKTALSPFQSPQYDSTLNLQDSRRSLLWDNYDVHEHGSDAVFEDDNHTTSEILSLKSVIHDIETSLTNAEECSSELLHMSVPRNELHSLLIASELTYAVITSLKINISEVLIITDSLVALCWLMNEKSRNRMYVQNQIITIHRYDKWMEDRLGKNVQIQIAHISGHQNPADLLTKEAPSPATIRESSVWMQGYPWMNLETKYMPLTRFSDVSLNKDQADQYLNEVILADPDSITVKTNNPAYHLYKSQDDFLPIHCVLPVNKVESVNDSTDTSEAYVTHKPNKQYIIDFIHLGWLKALRILTNCNIFFVKLFHKTHSNTKSHALKTGMTLKCKLCKLNFYTMHQL